MGTHALTALVFGASLLAGGAADAQRFIPFTVVPDACPGCPRAHLDTVRFTDGQEVQAIVVLDNPVFFLLERNGEVRAAPRALVASVATSTVERATSTRHVDQILLVSGHVLSGHITSEHVNGFYELTSADGRYHHTVGPAVIARVFKGGREVAHRP